MELFKGRSETRQNSAEAGRIPGGVSLAAVLPLFPLIKIFTNEGSDGFDPRAVAAVRGAESL